MSAPSAFRASYADWKLIKTRGVVSISFEVPLNESHLAYEALGGMPVAANEIWCGIARMRPPTQDGGANLAGNAAPNTGGNHALDPALTQPVSNCVGAASKCEPDIKRPQAFRDMHMPNQAGILCDTPAFQKFLGERLKYNNPLKAEAAADYVRRLCNVASRCDIHPRTPSGDRWTKLVDEYRTWMHAPELCS